MKSLVTLYCYNERQTTTRATDWRAEEQSKRAGKARRQGAAAPFGSEHFLRQGAADFPAAVGCCWKVKLD